MTDHNHPNVSGWSLESGYSNRTETDVYPLRVFDVEKNELTFSIRLSAKDLEPICQDIFTGFTIYLHTPGEVLSQTSVHNMPPNDVSIRIKPTLTVTSDGAQSYESSIRQCYFGSERRLRFFKYYTLSNCEAECLSNFMRQQCGCVKFSIPSKILRSPKDGKFVIFILQETIERKSVAHRKSPATEMQNSNYWETTSSVA